MPGASQEIFRVRGAVPAVTVGAPGISGFSSTSVMVTVMGIVFSPSCPSFTLSVSA